MGTLAIVLQAIRHRTTAEACVALRPTTSPGANDHVGSPPPSKTDADASPIAVPDTAIANTPIRVHVLHHCSQAPS
jgi:hypothetical protein